MFFQDPPWSACFLIQFFKDIGVVNSNVTLDCRSMMANLEKKILKCKMEKKLEDNNCNENVDAKVSISFVTQSNDD